MAKARRASKVDVYFKSLAPKLARKVKKSQDSGPVEKPLRRHRMLPVNRLGEPQSVSHHHNLA